MRRKHVADPSLVVGSFMRMCGPRCDHIGSAWASVSEARKAMIAYSSGVHQSPVRRRTYRPRTSFTFTRCFPIFRGTGRGTVHFHFRHEPLALLFYYNPNHFQLDMSETTVRIENEMDRWRFTCPRGHTRWEPTNHHFWCASCARVETIEASFDELRDRKTGRLYERESVRLLTAAGPYDRELDGRAD